jgi:nitroimidazol reductase NimA-like FMN-containing flavoprotein (pyridoxamine 5'-phosphate oxidase superfamily)
VQVELEGLEILDEDECRALLQTGGVGRVAVSMNALPAVFPVNYRLLGDSILFFTGTGTKLRAAMSNTVVAFEVDDFDADTETGWSVLVVGIPSEVTDPAVLASVRRLGLHPWAKGERNRLVRLHTDFVSGRRVPPAD